MAESMLTPTNDSYPTKFSIGQTFLNDFVDLEHGRHGRTKHTIVAIQLVLNSDTVYLLQYWSTNHVKHMWVTEEYLSDLA